MSDYEPPAALVDLKRKFLAAEARLAELGRSQPTATAIAAGEAELTDEQRAEWRAAFEEARRLAELLMASPSLRGEGSHARRMALEKAARQHDARPSA